MWPTILEPAALLLRLRVGLGVGVKADVLGLLIGVGGTWLSVREMSAALSYTPYAIRTAADDMREARLVAGGDEAPAKYRVETKRWACRLRLFEASPLLVPGT